MDKFGKNWPQLKGIIHAAGILEDATLLSQDRPKFERVLAPKVQGSWNLHTASLSKSLDFFVLYSSIAATLGAPGQSNYAAANAFLDGLAHYRHQQGLPALAIAWGAWAEVGMAAKLTERPSTSGVLPFKPELGIKALEEALKQTRECLVFANLDWTLILQKQLRKSAFYAELSPSQSVEKESITLLQQLKNAIPGQRKKMIQECLRRLVRTTLGLSADHTLSNDQGFLDLGMDSLMSIELKNKLQAEIGSSYALPPTLAFDHSTINALTTYLDKLLLPEEKAEEPEIKSKVKEMSLDAISLLIKGKSK